MKNRHEFLTRSRFFLFGAAVAIVAGITFCQPATAQEGATFSRTDAPASLGGLMAMSYSIMGTMHLDPTGPAPAFYDLRMKTTPDLTVQIVCGSAAIGGGAPVPFSGVGTGMVEGSSERATFRLSKLGLEDIDRLAVIQTCNGLGLD